MTKTSFLIVAMPALLAAGCGSAGPPKSTGQSSSNPGAAAYRYSDCMRSHGVTGFPDPRVSINGNHVSVIQALPPAAAASPHFKSAERACQGIMPGPGNARAEQQGHKQAFLAFARCMRARGVSGFPDPDPHGQITPAMLSASGVDLRSHAVYSAGIACAPVTHGLITAAQVRQATSGSH